MWPDIQYTAGYQVQYLVWSDIWPDLWPDIRHTTGFQIQHPVWSDIWARHPEPVRDVKKGEEKREMEKVGWGIYEN